MAQTQSSEDLKTELRHAEGAYQVDSLLKNSASSSGIQLDPKSVWNNVQNVQGAKNDSTYKEQGKGDEFSRKNTTDADPKMTLMLEFSKTRKQLSFTR